MTPLADLPFLDTADPLFSTRSASVIKARNSHWCAQTPYGIAVLRYRETGQILRDRRFRQGSHNWPAIHNLTGPFADFWSNSVIGREGADHRKLRDLAVPALSDDFITSMIPAFNTIANDLCNALRNSQTCEFQSEFSVPFAAQAITTLLGMDRADWRQISNDTSELGLAMGVECKFHETRVNEAYLRLHELARSLVKRVKTGKDSSSYVARLVDRFGKNPDLTYDELFDMIVISIFGGVDTTRSQLGLGLSLFIETPDQWLAFLEDETLAPNVVEEFIRARPTTTWVTREAIQTVVFNDVEIPKGTMVHLLVHSAARDPEICTDPNFDITIARKRHFGFGGGAHHCMGYLMARTDMTCALLALRKTFKTLSYDGPSTWLPDSGNTAPISLPLRYTRV